jgi:ABC-type transport system involved in multi-copper enzyme maturation permease subunit
MRIFLAEWRKLRRPTLFLGSMGAVVGVTALIVSLLFLLIDSETGNAERGMRITREVLALPSGLTIGFSNSAGLLGLVALCVFAAQTAQEYTYGTLRNLLVREPRRIRLLLGKYLAMSVFALISVIVSAITSVALAFALSGTAKVTTSAWQSAQARTDLIETFGNVLFSTIGYGTIGMVLGLLLRSPISSISIGVGWLLVVESIVSIAWSPSADWMPGSLLGVVAAGGSPIGVSEALSYSQALIRALAFLLVASLASGLAFRRRDVAS